MIGPLELILAFILDLSIGDPRWLPHPVRIIGDAITHTEKLLRAIFGEKAEKAAGILLVILIVVPSALVAFIVSELLRRPASGLLFVISNALLIYFIGTTIALRELVSSAKQVIDSVTDGMLHEARKQLSMIVGRDTANLSEEGILRATIETLAENLSDGVIAPVFYLAIGGLPLAIAYKAINTLDSMVGYKNDRYIQFGWAAARLDDLVNYIPARITGVFIALASFIFLRSLSRGKSSLKIMFRDGKNHSSPNSGVPEAAMAGALGVRLGGPSTYGGLLVEKPYIGDAVTVDCLAASGQALLLVSQASVLSVAAAAVLVGLRNMS